MLPVIAFPICGEFRLLSEALRGPVTVAWNAVHMPTARPARVTVLAPPPLAQPVVVEQMAAAFRAGGASAQQWKGPDTLAVASVDEVNGLPYAVTFLPDGALLDEWLDARSGRPIPLTLAMRIGSAVAHGVARAHERSITHGYVHPANVLLTKDERPLILDFAIHGAAAAAAQAAGFPLAGPTAVLPPHLAWGEDPRAADLYALGVLLLQLLSGTRLEYLKLAELAARLPRDVPPSLRESIGRALAEAPGDADGTPRMLGAHLAFDAAWLQALEPVTGPASAARPEFRLPAAALVEACEPMRVSGVGCRVSGGADGQDAGAGAHPTADTRRPTPEIHPKSIAPDVSRRTRRLGGAMAVLGVLLALGIGGGARLQVAPREEAPVTATMGSWIGIQVGPVRDQHAAISLQRRLRRLWPAALVRPDAGRYWTQVTTSAWPYRARAVARRLRAEGFAVRTVLQRRGRL